MEMIVGTRRNFYSCVFEFGLFYLAFWLLLLGSFLFVCLSVLNTPTMAWILFCFQFLALALLSCLSGSVSWRRKINADSPPTRLPTHQ